MFNFFKKKCPVCKMELKEGREYPGMDGRKFCSEECKAEYKKRLQNEQSKSGGCCCG